MRHRPSTSWTAWSRSARSGFCPSGILAVAIHDLPQQRHFRTPWATSPCTSATISLKRRLRSTPRRNGMMQKVHACEQP